MFLKFSFFSFAHSTHPVTKEKWQEISSLSDATPELSSESKIRRRWKSKFHASAAQKSQGDIHKFKLSKWIADVVFGASVRACGVKVTSELLQLEIASSCPWHLLFISSHRTHVIRASSTNLTISLWYLLPLTVIERRTCITEQSHL